MKFWQFLAFSEVDQLVGIARHAEALGFHGVLLGDHLFHPENLSSAYPYSPDGSPGFDSSTTWPDPWVTVGAMAAATTTLHFATSVYILPLRNPIQVAKTLATASALSSGRVALGTGAGWMKEEFDQMGIDFATRGRRYDEMIVVMRKLWQGGMVEHHGDHFDFDRLEIAPVPEQAIPIYIGGNSQVALRRAARLGDGWIGAGHLPDQIPEVLSELRRLRLEASAADDSLDPDRPFETIFSVGAAPDVELCRRLGEQGMTSFSHWPFKFLLGPRSSLEQKREAMARFSVQIIEPLTRFQA